MARMFPDRSVTAITSGTFTEAAAAWTTELTSAAVSTPEAAAVGDETVLELSIGVVTPHPAAPMVISGASRAIRNRPSFRPFLPGGLIEFFVLPPAPVGSDT